MDDSFELLEEKVRKAAELVRSLRKENHSLEQDLKTARSRLQEAQERLEAAQSEPPGDERGDDQGGPSPEQLERLEAELGELQQEREDVRRRIGRLVELLEGLD